jgi:dienelactone hydrolase
MHHNIKSARWGRQWLLAVLALVIPLGISGSAYATGSTSDCNPAPQGVAELVAVREKFHTVWGPLAEFNPCHRSVELSMHSKLFGPKVEGKPPLVIIAHGGGGLGRLEKNTATALNREGIATLVFDAYQMNGFYQGYALFGSQVSNEARQKMILKTMLGAYQWASKHPDIDTHRIFLQGVSNGGTVVLNMAALVDPRFVKGIIAEGSPQAGLGFPDTLNIPVRMVNGRLDNYGGLTQEDYMWARKSPCKFIGRYALAPVGVAENCNRQTNPESFSPSPLEWSEQQKAKGANIELWFYDQAAHGILQGPIDRKMLTYGTDLVTFSWTGSEQSAKDKLIKDMASFINTR